VQPPAAAQAAPAAKAEPAGKRELRLISPRDQLRVPAGRWRITTSIPAGRYVSLGVLGDVDGLRRFDLVSSPVITGLRARASQQEDGRLPAFVSFINEAEAHEITVELELARDGWFVRLEADPNDLGPREPQDLRLGKVEPRALVGLPQALGPSAGYSSQAPQRYQFVRVDVAAALRAAFRQTRKRFRRNAIGVGDASQWNGERPASDLGRPRHIRHEGGRDVDLALPSAGSPSTIRRRCKGVMVGRDVLRCSPGTVQAFDALRLAYFLGLLLDGPTPEGRYVPEPEKRPGPIAKVKAIYTDQVYIDEIRKALEILRERYWIHEEGYADLSEDGLLYASAWHVDHVHIQFDGEPGQVYR